MSTGNWLGTLYGSVGSQQVTYDQYQLLQYGGSYNYVKTPQETIEEIAAREREQLAEARRREAYYRSLRLARVEELRLEQQELQEAGMVINRFLVGCDPEFVVLDKNGQQMGTNEFRGEGVGPDHGGRVAEFRPMPTCSTYLIVKKLQRLIQSHANDIAGADRFRAGGAVGRDVIGGHVHIDLNPNVNEQPARIDALDMVTKRLEELDILPNRECESRRKGEYGKFGDYRVKASGSKVRFEYRTMASWLYDPRTAYICLTAAKLAAGFPESVETLGKGNYPWTRFKDWFDTFKAKDTDARRVREAVLAKGLRACQKDPDVDFRARWGELV